MWRKTYFICSSILANNLLVVVYRTVFIWVSNGYCTCFGFALLCSVIGQQNSRHFLDQWEAKPKPIAIWTRVFSRALRRSHVIALNSDWFIALFASVVIGQSNCFGFGFTVLNWKVLYDVITEVKCDDEVLLFPPFQVRCNESALKRIKGNAKSHCVLLLISTIWVLYWIGLFWWRRVCYAIFVLLWSLQRILKETV